MNKGGIVKDLSIHLNIQKDIVVMPLTMPIVDSSNVVVNTVQIQTDLMDRIMEEMRYFSDGR